LKISRDLFSHKPIAAKGGKATLNQHDPKKGKDSGHFESEEEGGGGGGGGTFDRPRTDGAVVVGDQLSPLVSASERLINTIWKPHSVFKVFHHEVIV
jgi:hypothetical protein